MTQVEFWFEFASTYSYPAAHRIEGMARAAGVTVVWRPFLLGAVFKSQGYTDSPFNIYPAKGRYLWRDVPVASFPFQLGSKLAYRGIDRCWHGNRVRYQV